MTNDIQPKNYTWRQRASFLLGRSGLAPAPAAQRQRRQPIGKVKPAGKRTAVIKQTGAGTDLLSRLGLVGRTDKERVWRDNDYDQQTLNKLSTDELVEMLVDLSPEVSRILWDLLRFGNSGYTIKGLNLSDDNENEAAQVWVDGVMDTLRKNYGVPAILFNRLFVSLAMRGAVFGEIVLDETATRTVDVISADPVLAEFKRVNHPERGQFDALGQTVGSSFVDLSGVLTVSYIPLDPMPDDPYGRGLLSPIVFSTLFMLGLLHDLRRVIAQQGFTRYHVQVKIDELLDIFNQMDVEGQDEEEEFSDFVNDTIDALREMLENLQPDESLVTTDAVDMKSPGGALSDSSIAAADSMIRAINRAIIVGGKTMPLLMASNEAVSETHANRQWEIHVATVRTLQHIVESFVESLLDVGMRAAGIQGRVQLRFAELRKSERMRDELVQQQINMNAQFQYLMGWINHRTASVMATGKEPARERPLIIDLSTGADLVDDEGLAPYGSNNEGLNGRLRGMWNPETWRIVGENQPLPVIPQQEDISNSDINRAINRWDTLMPDYAGLLNASIDGVAQTSSDWTYDLDELEYRHNDTDEVVDQARLRELRDEFASLAHVEVVRSVRFHRLIESETRNGTSELAEQLLNEDISLQDWVQEMRLLIKDAYIAQYTAAKGGRHNMTAADWGRIGRMMAPDGQYAFLNGFADDIVNKDLSLAQIKARANLYINSSTQAFERGRAALYNIRLPTYPADGSQVCLANCKCFWEIIVVDGEIRCYWRINAGAENCETCLGNQGQYNPYIAEAGA